MATYPFILLRCQNALHMREKQGFYIDSTQCISGEARNGVVILPRQKKVIIRVDYPSLKAFAVVMGSLMTLNSLSYIHLWLQNEKDG